MESSASFDTAAARHLRPTEARFPHASPGDGLYESFYARAGDRDGDRGVWIRYTVLKKPGEAAVGSLWFTFFERGGGGPVASIDRFEAELHDD